MNNFFARLVDPHGNTVPGSVRKGHNVFTYHGREVLTKLVAWDSIDPTLDVPFTGFGEYRIRWFGVGSGVQVESLSVSNIVSPLAVDIGGDFMKPIDPSLTTFPTVTSVKHKLVFGPGELSHAGAVIVTEAALFADNSGDLDPGVGTNPTMFYKTFEGLVKMPAFSLEIEWEHKF